MNLESTACILLPVSFFSFGAEPPEVAQAVLSLTPFLSSLMLALQVGAANPCIAFAMNHRAI